MYVSPVTLKMRHNPYATGAISAHPARRAAAAGRSAADVVVRRMLDAGSVRNLAQSGAAGITYFETTGWRGVMETDRGSPVPDKFRSHPRRRLPGLSCPGRHRGVARRACGPQPF